MRGLLIFSLIGYAFAATWSYEGDHGVEHWDQISATCGGQRQSPIDIPYADTSRMMYGANLGSIVFSGYDNMTAGGLNITNTGHSAQININSDSPSDGQVIISGGGLNGTYVAVQLHFHWGKSDKDGSEHLFRGRQYPLELHIVHYKQEYGGLVPSLEHGDGLAVLGFFFVMSEDDNDHLQPIISGLKNIKYKGHTRHININFNDIISGSTDEFYRYDGSLTTPTCDEAVIWTVFEKKITISSSQLEKFRHLYESEQDEAALSLPFNYRPTQALYSRMVYKNYEEHVPHSYHWSYHGHSGPEYWQDYYATCRGHSQSPINIPAVNSPMLSFNSDLNLDTLEFHNYDQPIIGKILNNGHNIQVNVETNLYIEHGGLDGKYRAAQFHFHWGHDNMHGSEHKREGRSYPLELHIVHYKEEYGSLGDAVNRDDGLAVIGFFYRVSNTSNTGYSEIVSKLPTVRFLGKETNVSGFTMEDLTFPKLKKSPSEGIHTPYFRYNGGLTTPPCSQVVTWSVMMVPVPIQADQLAEFRKVMHVTEDTAGDDEDEDNLIKENYRPTQSLNTRPVYMSYDLTISGASVLLQSIVTCVCVVFLGVILS